MDSLNSLNEKTTKKILVTDSKQTLSPLLTPLPYSTPCLHSWSIHSNGTLLVLDGPDIKAFDKIAAFDLDDTLIRTKSGKRFSTGPTDWKWKFAPVPEKIKTLHGEGYKVLIFSNQKGISIGKQTIENITTKVSDIVKSLGIPIQVFIATADNKYRKPWPNSWRFFLKRCSETPPTEINLKGSFYCGDAAGRRKAWDGNPKTKKDFSCSDRKFAANCGLHFCLPEEVFLESSSFTTNEWDWRSLNPTEMLKQVSNNKLPMDLASSTQEMIISVGFPATGKTTFAKQYLLSKGYVHINRDLLKTQSACIRATRKALQSGHRVVIDNTNPSVAARSRYITVAREIGVPVRCFVFDAPRPLAEHLNCVRAYLTKGQVKKIPAVAYHTFAKYFKEPELSEGIAEIVKIPFISSFEGEKNKAAFLYWT